MVRATSSRCASITKIQTFPVWSITPTTSSSASAPGPTLLRVLGIDQRAAHEDGTGNYAVAEANMRFFAPARLDDSLVVQTDLAELRAASVRLVQRVARGEELLVELAIRVGFIAPNGRPRRQPDAWRAAFDQFYRPKSESSQ